MIPVDPLRVHEQPHEFGDGQGGMGIESSRPGTGFGIRLRTMSAIIDPRSVSPRQGPAAVPLQCGGVHSQACRAVSATPP